MAVPPARLCRLCSGVCLTASISCLLFDTFITWSSKHVLWPCSVPKDSWVLICGDPSMACCSSGTGYFWTHLDIIKETKIFLAIFGVNVKMQSLWTFCELSTWLCTFTWWLGWIPCKTTKFWVMQETYTKLTDTCRVPLQGTVPRLLYWYFPLIFLHLVQLSAEQEWGFKPDFGKLETLLG